MFKAVVASVALLAFASVSSAQVIYEPVKFEHRFADTDQVVYYGGSNPRVIEHARSHYALYNQPRSYDGHGHERATIRKGLTGRAPYVFTDAAPYVNASLYGFTDVDARNEANAAVPTYFRKRDLLAAGVVQADGSLIVPANAKPAPTVRVVRRRLSATQPTPKAIIIIPKGLLTPKKPGSDKSLTLAE